MRALRPVLIGIGVVLVAAGALFLLQGAGVVRWPASSFMIGARVWMTYGALLALAGAVLVLGGRRLR